MDMSPTAYVSVESACGRFVLMDLYRGGVSLYQTPSLQIKVDGEEVEMWDNDKYILELFKAIETDTHTSHYLELMMTCDTYGWNIDDVCSQLVEVYAQAKELKMFKL